MSEMLAIPYRCPECETTAIVQTDLTRMPVELARRFREEPALSIETECVKCVAALTAKQIDLVDIKPGEERLIHMVCGTLHGPEQRCPLGGAQTRTTPSAAVS